MDKLAGITFPTVGKRVFPEDWIHEQESKSDAIIKRDMDAFGAGIDSGGTIVVGSGANHVDLTDTLIAYDEFGKRVCVPATANIVVPNNVTFTLVVRHKFQETQYDSPSNMPSDGPIIWRDDSYEFICRQGSVVTGDILLRLITTNGSGAVTLGSDLRVWRGLKGNRIKDSEITESKLSTSVKTGLITDLHPDIVTGINPDTNNPLKFVKGINQVYLFFKNFLDVTFKQEKKFVGEMFWMDDIRTPSTDFPAFCLASPDQLINSSGAGAMPDLVSYWLNKPFRYDPLGTNITDFDAISYTISSNVLTVTFANTTACQKMIDALVEDNLVHGSFTNWMTGTLQQAIGAAPASATLSISALSSGSRTISFTCAAANSSGSLSGVKVRFYKHRLPDITAGTTITNQVRHFAMQGRGFVAVMDSDSDWIGGLRRRDRFQPHGHNFTYNNVYGMIGGGGSNWLGGGTTNAGNVNLQILEPITYGSYGTPRTGKTTDARGLSAFPYVFVKRIL
ncbi:hypothetical protein [Leptospira interrogans]|uniref:Uncharacterized protein n=1 Tax=Leptospira interrogans str. UI 12621 TaxID=1049937 RepID=A0A0F6H448_LEPIR|nr:hypothetical protein [Leptospira interrogans]EKO22973.1 hypothetical protein LEP1GSC104_4133 [Leptospira interrogans str. UI 12621]EMO01858.1 hypothetical protein LEP1GSC112_0154 [Leptospira interrogans serovar Pomona str. UT364]EMO94327.1 hypothetical protein LEP1GSC109_2934 [Leptospira interrogans str. UI 13372]KGE28340.1 hypothetical protein IQ65_00935 [Leptospira interrogans serovar Lai]